MVSEGTTPDGVAPPKRIRLTEESGGPSEPVGRFVNEPPSSTVLPNNPNLPEGGLWHLLQEKARKMVSEAGGDGTDYIHVLEAWLEGNDQLPELVEAATHRMLQDCRPRVRGNPIHRHRIAVKAPRNGRSRQRKNLAKRRAFFACQFLYRKDRARLAGLILDGGKVERCPIPRETIYSSFQAKWETPVPFGGLGRFGAEMRADNTHLMGSISQGEIQSCLQLISSASAPGPDGIEKRDILNWDPKCETLTRLFNMWWFTGVVPTRLKKSRTVLIPKTFDPGAVMEVGNWSPITIGSMILRLFTRVVNKQMQETCPIHLRQRGFRPSPRCAENIEAFDTVSHEHILSALRQMNVDPHMIGLIQQIYTDSATHVEVRGGTTPDIKVRVGVKQGDPMSPLLFNRALDPLIQGLERYGKGYTVAGHSVTSLAYADDLDLIGGSWSDMAHNLLLLDEFCQNTCLRVNPRKCHSFLFKPCSGAFTVNDCTPWVLGGMALQQTSIADTVKYLGVKFNPWGGVDRPDLEVVLDKWFQKIGKSLLKPSQSVVLLNQYAVSRLFYQADLCEVREGVLQSLDGIIRRFVKKWLHLPQSTCDGLLYARNRDGGLGICKLSRQIPSIQVKRLYCLSHSTDVLVRDMMDSSRKRSKFKGAWRRASGSEDSLPPLGGEDSNAGGDTTDSLTSHLRVCPVPSDWRKDEFLRWAGLPTQGVYACVYPTQEFLYRGRSKAGAACRRCSYRLESCSHILGQCPAIQEARIARHSKLCRLLRAEAEVHGWEGELRRLDLVLIRDSKALAIDLTVRYEFAPDSLSRAAQEKLDYYSPHSEVIARELDVSEVEVLRFPLGSPGPVG
ncbi:unnamed protein product [Leuciscus chuanchicus]